MPLLTFFSWLLLMPRCTWVVMRVCVRLAGVAQGCPAFTMVFYVVAEVRVFLALVRVRTCWERGGGGGLQQTRVHG